MDVFHRILSFPYLYFKNRTTGEIVSRIQDLSKVREMIEKLFLSLSLDLLLTLFSAVVLFFLSPTLFFISCLILVCYILILLIFRSRLNSDIEYLQQENSFLNSFMIETFIGIENIKFFSTNAN